VTILELEDNHIQRLSELNRLGALTNIQELVLRDNPVTESHLFRLYAVFRLIHLTRINGDPVTNQERLEAEDLFSNLSNTFFQGSKPPPWVHAHQLPRAPTGFKQLSTQSLSDLKSSALHAKTQNALVAESYLQGIVGHAVVVGHQIQSLNQAWPSLMEEKIGEIVAGLVDEERWAEGILQGMRVS